MLRILGPALLSVACSGGCGGTAATAPESHGPTRLEPGLADEVAAETETGSGPRRIEEEAVDPPPVEPPPP